MVTIALRGKHTFSWTRSPGALKMEFLKRVTLGIAKLWMALIC